MLDVNPPGVLRGNRCDPSISHNLRLELENRKPIVLLRESVVGQTCAFSSKRSIAFATSAEGLEWARVGTFAADAMRFERENG